MLKGIGSSSGIAYSKAFILKNPEFKINDKKISDVNLEIKKVKKAFEKTINQLIDIKSNAISKIGEAKASVFDAHIQIVEDPEILSQIEEKINSEKLNAAYVVNFVYKATHDIFFNMEDDYFKQRASDINDVLKRILSNLMGVNLPDLVSIKSEVILVANDLTPSETALLDKKFIKGFVTNIGGRTSHAAIMARTMEIPAVLGLKVITEKVKNNDYIAIDGDLGIVEINPKDKKGWLSKIEKFKLEQEELKKYINVKAKTLDGHIVDVEANIGKPKDADKLESYGADGVGLYRSEFLYMDQDEWPTEDQQFESYKYVLEKQKGHLVVVRTLDIGGDKNLNYYKFDHEENPFLGYRAIRFCLDSKNKNIFKTQLRALIRASAYGQLGIMFPMIATVEELLKAKKIYQECVDELKKENIKISNDIKIGMMIEIPSSALLADIFSQYVDFFSVGTNDLIQYTFAVDRMSEKISYLYQPTNPSLLRILKLVIEGAKKNNTIVAMCGEMASDLYSIPLLLGLGDKGLDAFSMTASSIPKAKKTICSLNYEECKKLANKAITLETPEEVKKLVHKFLVKNKIL